MGFVLKKIDTGPIADLDRRIRIEWASNIADALAEWVDPHTGRSGMTRKEFQLALAGVGCEVSQQTISLWLNAKAMPRPSAQVAIGKVFGTSARLIFPLKDVA